MLPDESLSIGLRRRSQDSLPYSRSLVLLHSVRPMRRLGIRPSDDVTQRWLKPDAQDHRRNPLFVVERQHTGMVLCMPLRSVGSGGCKKPIMTRISKCSWA